MEKISRRERRNRIKPIFRALNPFTRVFGDVVESGGGQKSNGKILNRNYSTRALRLFARSIPVFSALLVFVLIFTYAKSDVALTRKLDTMFVLPGSVISVAWQNRAALSNQDVSEDGIYQSFSKNNSAYLDPFGEESVQGAGSANTPSDAASPSADPAAGSESVDTDVLPEQSGAVDNAVPTDADVVPAPESESPSDSAPDNAAPQSEPAQESAYMDTSSTFVSTRAFALPFANEVVTEEETSVVTENVVDTPSFDAVVTPDSAEIDPAPVASEEGTQAPAVDESAAPQADEIVSESPSAEEITELVSEGEVAQIQTLDASAPAYPITFTDFGIPPLASGQFITNVQLRMSFAAQYNIDPTKPLPVVDVEYSIGDTWEDAGSIVLDEEISNALNGGYFLFALPTFEHAEDLKDLSVRVVYRGDVEALNEALIDAVWLEVDTETFDREILNERVQPEALDHLDEPAIDTLISDDVDFTREEIPSFTLRYNAQRNFAIRFLRNIFADSLATIDQVNIVHNEIGDVPIEPKIEITADGLITIKLRDEDTELMQPGTYTVELMVNEGGKVFKDTFEFQWGLLAINPDQTEYEVGDVASIALGALSPGGNTLCNADLALYIIDPNQFISRLPVTESGLCNGNNVVDSPDYRAQLTVDTPGVYEMYVEHLDAHGEVLAHTQDTFVVENNHNLWIARNGPTRIYPLATYPMDITVTAKETFRGTLTERVPADFEISRTDAVITEKNGEQLLTWEFEMLGGTTKTFSYAFDAPDISPYLYSVGPANLLDDRDNIVVSELVPASGEPLVQEAVTETAGVEIVPVESESAAPATEPAATPSEPAASEPVPSETVATPDTVTETAPADAPIDTVPTAVPDAGVVSPLDTVVEPQPVTTEGEPAITPVSETASTTEVVPEPVVAPVPEQKSTFAEHRAWQIASDATGSMIVFWTDGASIPAGWTCISCTSGDTFYQRFPKGGATYGTTGGASTHNHTASGAVNASASANAENAAGTFVAIVSHSHTITPTVASTSSLPAYRSLRVIQNNSAGTPVSIPAGAILMFDGSLPAGWGQYSPLDARYPMGHNSIVSSSTNTHVHSVTGTTGAAAGTTYDSRTGGTQVTAAAATHTHTINGTAASTNFEPPYIEVIFATSSVSTSTPTDALAMWSDTPPAGWLDRSSTSTKPFYDRYIKGAATYGTTGGASTHTHGNQTITSGAAVGTDNARTGTFGARNTHTHAVDVSSFSTASNTPPYVSVIIAKYYGVIPIFDQSVYRWYANTNAITPTDAWPVGTEGVAENESIDTTFTPVKNNDIIRLRLGVTVSNASSTGEILKLQYGTTTDLCTAVPSWTDVGAAASSTDWIGYNNAAVADGATLSSSTLTGTDEFESYEEFNPAVTLPNMIGVDEQGEFDFVLKQNGADPGTYYCFRLVEEDGTEFFSYTEYPRLITNASPVAPTLSKLFDNEKTATTTPVFEFVTTDSEANDVSYQIQIDDDYTFGSVNVDRDTVNNPTQFENIITPSDKDPYTHGQTVRFTLTSPLTNNTTYYWRVRGNDPTGSNAWGSWSTIYSFTIDTAVTVTTWHQTMEEQFDTNTLVGTDAISTDLVQLISGSTTGTTTSSEIDFLDGVLGNAWGSLSWTDNETTGDIKYRLQYYDETSASWLFISDSALSGNSAGFDTSPVSLLALDVDTYRRIRVVGIFTNSGGSPTLSDWTVSWGYRIDTPTQNAPFPNEKVGTTTPTFEFFTTDPQDDDLEYEIQWSTTYAFTASTTRTSSANGGFVNITTGGDLDPFFSGDVIQFTVQVADALTNGTTYWWRVRARDPLGGNEWSFYSDKQSFTVDTTVTVSTWFQTTNEQFDTDILSGAISLPANTVTVATTTSESLAVYAEGTITTPRFRIWDGSTWGAEADALDVGAAILWDVARAAPSDNEYVLATMGSDGDVNAQVYRNGSWGDLQEMTTTIADTNMRGFDVAYETVSGDAIVVYCDGDADPGYYTWNGSSWTSGGAVGLTSANSCGWIKLISDPVSDEIIAVTRDTTGVTYEARVWDGSAWGNSATWGSMQSTQTNHEGMAAEYEESGGQAVVAVSNGTSINFTWRAWDGTSWTAAATVNLGDDFESGTIARDSGSDNMVLCYMDEDADIGVVRWTGAAWTGQTELYTGWTNADSVFGDRPIDCGFEVGGARDGYIMAAYSNTTQLVYQYWNGATWSVAAVASTIQDSPRVQMRRTRGDILQVLAYDNTNDRYDYSYWNGTTWSALQTIETDGAAGASPYKEPFMIAAKNPGTTGTVVGSPEIDFYAGSGPYWQQMSWTDTEAGGSSILYQVEYYDGDSWELVPDGVLSGNSSGFGTSPIDLTTILPVSTYRYLRPVANMTCNLGTCPVLSDWTITWSEGITVSGTAQAFDQTTNVTAGTVAIALNGVLQTGKTGSIAGGTWSIANVNAAPDDVVTVFINGANEANEAIAIGHYDGVGNMSGLRLYEQHLTLGSNDATTTAFTNTQIGLYDYTNDEDLFFNVTGTELSMCADATCGDSELYIYASSTYTPTGDSLLNNIEINGNFVMGTSTIYVARSWDNNGTTTPGTSQVSFTATSTTETIDETGALTPSFYNLTFGTTTGSATWTLNTPLDVNGALTVSRGTLARGTQPITVAGALTTGANGLWSGVGTTTFDGTVGATWTDQNATLQNIGRVAIDGTTKTVTLGSNVLGVSLTIGADDALDVSGSNYSITTYGDWINNNTFTARSGTVYFAATTTNKLITAGGDAFYNINFTGAGGSWSFSEANLSISNDLTFATGTVTMPTGTTTLSGSFVNSGGTFAHNNGLMLMNTSGAETLTIGGSGFINTLYNIRFSGSGSWSFVDTHATTSNNFVITQGSVTLPSSVLSVGGDFTNSGGTFAHNSGTILFTAAGARTIDTNASFNNLTFIGSGSWSFVDASVTLLGDLTTSAGTLTLPTGTITIGGSIANTAALAHNNGTVLLNATASGKTIDLGASSLYTLTVNSATGGWTMSNDATTTNAFTLTAASAFTLASGKTLAVGGTFTNSVGGASTTWTGATLSLETGAYSLNTKTTTGDTYGTLRVKANTDIAMWNSSADAYAIDSTGSLYSEDHASVDGDLYIFGAYERTSGTEYWNYSTDFDGTALGGSSRQVDVHFASGATAALTNSTLSLVGSTTATTTIANQGSGTYTVNIVNGTTTAQYYDFVDLGATGLALSGTNRVTSLSDGRFVPATAGGAGLTVSSTTIDQNPQLQIHRVSFATTSAIAAYNVAQTDGTPSSYWWFRGLTGNIAGESFDNDTGDPGSIRWDDSSLMITVTGTVYGADETTPLGGPTCGAGTPVRIVVSGGSTYDGACDGSGNFSIPNVVIVGDPTLTVYLNGAAGGERAVTVTKTPTADITDLNLMVNHVVVRHEDVDAMTIADMATYDSTDDADIPFTAATGTTHSLTVAANTELHVASSTTFTPGGTVTLLSGGTGTTYDGTLHIDDAAIFTGAGTTTYSIGGSLMQDTSATFIPASSTIVMTATTSGKTITTATGETLNVNELQFTGVNGGWNLNGDITATDDVYVATGTVTGTNDLTLTGGSFYGDGLVSLGTGTTTVELTNTLGGTQGWTFANLVLGNGTVTGTTTPGSSATTTILGKLTISTGHFLDAGSSVWDFRGAGTVFVENGTFQEDTSTVRYSGTAGANVLSTTYYDLLIGAQGSTPTHTGTGLGIIVLNDLIVGSGAAATLSLVANDPALDVDGDVYIASGNTFIASDSGLFTVAGNWDNNGTFTGSGGTVTFNGAGTVTLAPGSSSWSTAVINGAGSFSVTEHATATTAFTLTNAGDFTVDPGVTLAVGGTFSNGIGGAATTWTGSTLYLYGGGNYTINASTTSDTYATLAVAPNTDIRMWGSSAATANVDTTGSLYSMDHAGANGALYVYGAYERTSGNDYWSYATDFDGTDISASPRTATVSFASGASALYTGGGLSVIGAAGASTSITNQGSGTYSLRIGGSASTTLSYYTFANMDTAGLTFSGAPTVNNISRGSFTVSQNGGTAITVGGSVIDQNQAKTFTNNVFATTTGVTASNVTATGTTVSSWRFTNHSGVIAGEAFDVDPDGDPGYIVWDDSASSISISGRVYSDEGTSVSTVCDSSTNNIHIRIAGLTSYTTSCNGDGAGGGTGLYNVSGITFSPGDSLIVYIDGNARKAAVVTEDPVTSVNNLDLYEDRVIVRHEGADPLSIADMALWDSSDDADIPFTAVDSSPDTLTLPADRKLIVWGGKTFAPGGNVTVTGGGAGAAHDGTLELYASAVFTAAGTESHIIGGSFVSGVGATFTAAQSTVTFTTSGAARTIDTNDGNFYNLVLNGSGSWTNTNSVQTIGNDLTITQGALTLSAGTTTIAGSFLNTGGSFNKNGGEMLFTAAAAETIRMNGSLFGTTTFNGAGSWTMLDTNATSTGDVRILSGTLSAATGTYAVGGEFVNAGTFTHGGGTLRFTSAAASTTVTAGGSDLGSTTFAGAGSYVFTDGDVALAGSLRIEQGTVALATGTMSIAGSLLNTGGTFIHATGTVLFNSSDTGESINPGSSTFNNVSIAAPTGGYTITAHATTTGAFALTSAASFTLAPSTRLAVGGVFTNLVGGANTTWLGSTLYINTGAEYVINTKLAGGDFYNIIAIDNDTDLRMWNSNATTSIVDSLSSLYSMDNSAVNGELYVYGNYERATGADYWSYATDFDGTSLSGGSERIVNVRMASGATSTFSGGTLEILGASGATTTITNQGSGVYGMNITGGTYYALNYAFRNLAAAGLSISGQTTITSMANGDFELAVNGGTLMTVSSTTINYNATMVTTGMRFATSSAITGYNVTVVGSTPSAWTFTSHRGNLSGEGLDVDGATDCGSIRWSDSTCLLTQQSAFRWRNDDGGEGVPNSEWYDTNWSKRKRVTVTNADATAYTDAVVPITVTFDGDMQSDFDDLRFTDASGITSLSYVRESYTPSTDALIWVKVPTLAASDDTEIYMYYGNGSATSGSVGTTTFAVYDDFEDNNITEYSGDTSLFTPNASFAFQGTYGLKAVNVNDRTTDGIYNTSATVSQGQTIRFMQYVDTSAGSGDETCTLFGVQSPGSNNNNYAICLEQYGVDRVSISRDVRDNDTSGTVLASTTITYATGWYEVEVDWGTDDTIAVSVYQDDVLVATTSATNGAYTSGGMGFTYWFQHGGWDLYSARTLMTTEPTTTVGYEQVRDGASWRAALNTVVVGVDAGDTVRPRFVIENTGLSVSDEYQLEFAAKGGAPSCEAVDSAQYDPVPVQASCGTSAVCMQSSSQYSDQASTIDLLGGDGTFTPGKIVEDPSNAAGSVTLNSNEYTEVEYAVGVTLNATDSSYCFRVTDNGTPIDSYTRVAEMQLVFAPNITSLTFNNGADILLNPGGTTTVYATGTVTDLNGYGDITAATTTFYRSGIGASCTADLNNCYIATAPTSCSYVGCSGNSCDIVCSADVYYHADPTDAGTYGGEFWGARLTVNDSSGLIASTTQAVDLITLRALSVDNTIDYGSLEANADTGSYNATTTFENIGNDALDVSIEGTDLSDGGSSLIPVNEQIFATSTFNYSACVFCTQLSNIAANYELDLAKPTSPTPSVTDQLFWGIAVPYGVAAAPHQGANVFYAIGD